MAPFQLQLDCYTRFQYSFRRVTLTKILQGVLRAVPYRAGALAIIENLFCVKHHTKANLSRAKFQPLDRSPESTRKMQEGGASLVWISTLCCAREPGKAESKCRQTQTHAQRAHSLTHMSIRELWRNLLPANAKWVGLSHLIHGS